MPNGVKVNIKDVYIETKGEFLFNNPGNQWVVSYVELNMLCGIIVKNEKGGKYYGTDFSGFKFLWVNGEICFESATGQSYFSGQIDEEWLVNNAFTKAE